jgi:outer membrane protein assembly factor BamB
MYQHTANHNAVFPGTGSALTWEYDAGAKINSGLALVAGRILFDTFAGAVVALDAHTGKPVWVSHVDNIAMSTPVVADGIVIIGTGANGALGSPKSSSVYDPGVNHNPDEIWGRAAGDHVVAFDLQTGNRIWNYRTAGEDMPSPAIAGSMIVFANGDQHAYGLDLRTGRAVWRRDIAGVSTMASATAIPSAVLVSSCNLAAQTVMTFALEPKNGSVRWSVPFGDCDASPTSNDRIVFLSGVEEAPNRKHFGWNTATAVDIASGHILWRYKDSDAGPFTGKGSHERAIAGVFAGDVYIQSMPCSKKIVAFDAASGEVKWAFQGKAPVKMSPVVAGDRVYFGDASGRFYKVDARSGRMLAVRRFVEGFSTSPPIVVGQTVLLVSNHVVRAVSF